MEAGSDYEFDTYRGPRLMQHVHLSHLEMARETPEIFHTPKKGDQWAVTSNQRVKRVVRDHENFSNCELEVPKTNSSFGAIPINLDPPEHISYRKILMKHLTPRVITDLETVFGARTEDPKRPPVYLAGPGRDRLVSKTCCKLTH